MGSHSSSPEDRPNPGMEPRFPTLQVDSLPVKPPRKPFHFMCVCVCVCVCVYIYIYIYSSFFLSSTADKCIVCFYLLLNNSAVNIPISWCTCAKVSLEYKY